MKKARISAGLSAYRQIQLTINFIINASFGTGRGEKASMTEP